MHLILNEEDRFYFHRRSLSLYVSTKTPPNMYNDLSTPQIREIVNIVANAQLEQIFKNLPELDHIPNT